MWSCGDSNQETKIWSIQYNNSNLQKYSFFPLAADAMGDLEQKITGYDLWYLKLTVTSRRDQGIGSVERACEIVILRLRTEDGTEGFGEASSWSVFTGTPKCLT